MRRSSGWLVAIGGLIAAMAAGALSFYPGFFGLYGCDHSDRAQAELLLRDPGFIALGEQFPQEGEAYSGCDDDDRVIHAGVELSTGLGREEGERAIEAILTDAGWVRAEPANGSCFVKRIRGHLAAVEVDLESSIRDESNSDFSVGVTSPPWFDCGSRS